ncbi:MAG: ankyrin repeat domain-containing protein [Deltaproteobacteria bacterium]|nr:ankyrin repeat domain-containing protein [Deltaproteobacteria bacterium]
MLAVRHQSKESVKETLNFEAMRRGELFLRDKDGRTALFYAAERGDEEIVWMLLSSLAGTGIGPQRGALLEVRDNDGVLAEDWAQINGQEEIRRILSIERQRIAYFE